MTVFSDGTKESLHGHNYQVSLKIRLEQQSDGALIPFGFFKDVLRELCGAWDERVLVARNCKFLNVNREEAGEIEFVLCGRRYVLPQDEVVWLDCENVTSEALAEIFTRKLVDKFSTALDLVQGVEIKIEETLGQGASFSWPWGDE